jgi:hypothetical protein
MSNVPTNLIPTRITQLPEAPVADPAGYFPIVISGTTYKVQFSQIQGNVEVPASRQVIAGTGLTGGGSLSQDITIAVANGGIGNDQLDTTGVGAGSYGSSTEIPVITVNSKGRVTSLSTTGIVISGYVPDSRQIVAGTGLTGGGDLSANRTLAIDYSSTIPSALGSASVGTASTPARADHVHPALDLADGTETSGVLPMGRGGTGANLSPVAGAVVVSNGSNFQLSNVGNPGQVLYSNGASPPDWYDTASLTVDAARRLLNGAANRVVYQSDVSETSFVVAPVAADTFLKWNGSGFEWGAVAGAGTVTSVDGSGGTTGLTVSGGPINAAGTLTLGGTLAISAGGTGLGGTPTNGQLLIGDGSGYVRSTLTAGTNVTITNATGSITIAAAGDVVGPAGATSNAIALFDGGTGKLVKNSVITISGSGVISGVATPDVGTDAANKQYVDDLVSTGIHIHTPVVLATSPGSSRTDTYNNGTAGVSATLTSVANGTLVIDGTVASATIRVLIQDCSNPVGNGVYVVTNAGSAGAQYVMTRSSDADTTGQQSTQSLDDGSYFFTTGGTSNKGASWVNTNTGNISFGSTAITFAQFSASQVYSAGNGLSLTATTFSLETPVSVLNGGVGLSSAPTNGQLLIGNGAGYTLAGLTAGTGVSVTNATGSITLANTAPDQTVIISGSGIISVTGTYPSFTVGAVESFSGTVTSVNVAGGSTGLTFSGGPVTGSGTITLAGTLAITNGGTGASTQSDARTALGLGTIATQDANNVSITGGSIGASVLVNLSNSTGNISGGTY